MEDENLGSWLKLYRRSLDHPLFTNPAAWHFWEYCLLKARDKSYTSNFAGQEREIERGAFTTGRTQAARETGLTEKQVRGAIDKLCSLGMIEKIKSKSTNRYTYLRVCNFDKFQARKNASGPTEWPAKGQPQTQSGTSPEGNQPSREGPAKGQQRASKGPAKGQQRATSKESKEREEREEGKEITPQPPKGESDFVDWWADWKKSIFRGTGGNRKAAEKYFKLLLKNFTVEEIRQSTAIYLQLCRNTETYHKDAEGFLNPSKGLVSQYLTEQVLNSAPVKNESAQERKMRKNREVLEQSRLKYGTGTATNRPGIT